MDERPIEDIEFVITWTVQQEDGSIRTYQVGPYASPDTAASEIADWWVMPEVGTTISAEISAKPDDWKRDEDVRELSVVSADQYLSTAEVRYRYADLQR